MKPTKKQNLSITVTNSGYDRGDMMEVNFFSPPKFKVAESADYEIYI